MHYLFSHYAFAHPENFLDHWAKPLFVLLSSPFAYFGFKGMILFNVICTTLTALTTYHIGKNLKLKYPLLIFPMFLGAPLFFQLIFSGLTEYLFALITVLGIYLIQINKATTAILLVSFLPMVRSEGLIVIGVFGIYLLASRQYKKIPLLFIGQLIYTLIGVIYHQDLFWVMTDIPYANVGSPYGHGGLFDFVFKLMFAIEKPLFLLVIGGLGLMIYQLWKRNDFKKNKIKYLLIGGTFIAIFLAHSIFWYLGIFNSMGLPRVLIAIVPLGVLIALFGFDSVLNKIQKYKLKKTVLFITIFTIIAFPFIPKSNGIVYNEQMFKVLDHRLIEAEVAPYIQSEFPNYREQLIYFSHPYLSCALDIDYFDQSKHLEMQHLMDTNISPGTLVIWDNWFSVSDGGIDLDYLSSKANLKVLGTFSNSTTNDRYKFVIFEAIHE